MGIDRILQTIDRWHQKHRVISFPYAVIKKYGDDNGSYHSALLTYYGFLSLFPLLLVTTTLIQLVFHDNPGVKHEVANAVGHFFPLLGNQLEKNIHGMKGAGIGLVVGLLFTLYGARGGADALRFALDNMWQVPKKDRPTFPKSVFQSLSMMGIGGLGFIATMAVSSFSASLGHALWVKILLNIAGFAVTFAVLLAVYSLATVRQVPVKFMMVGSAFGAAILQLILTFGSLLLAHQMKNLGDLYGTFAMVLGLLFWIFLLAQVVLYSAQIDTVRYFKLWPRSLSGKLRTDADKHAYKLYAKTEEFVDEEDVDVKV